MKPATSADPEDRGGRATEGVTDTRSPSHESGDPPDMRPRPPVSGDTSQGMGRQDTVESTGASSHGARGDETATWNQTPHQDPATQPASAAGNEASVPVPGAEQRTATLAGSPDRAGQDFGGRAVGPAQRHPEIETADYVRPTAAVPDAGYTATISGHALGEAGGESSRTGADPVEPREIADYQIQGTLGRGGMGVVYRARHRTLGRTVALKMILNGDYAEPEALKRFVAEARAVAKLQHPGIMHVFDIGEHDGVPWFSLEFIDGRDLRQELRGQPREPRAAAELVAQLCDTMQYAHGQGVLHRDLKPSNVMLDTQGRPKIMDFGLARNVDPESSLKTREGTIMGTPSYMPPEQARGEVSSLSPRSDQYSLAAILYEMLTARPPFIAARPLDTILQVVRDEPVPPRRLQPGIPVDLETICLKGLQKEQAARYADCAEMAADLRRFLNGEPIAARPISRPERAWRWCKRNPKVAVPSTLAAVFVLATAIISTWAWSTTSAQAALLAEERDKVRLQRDEAQRERDEARRQRTIANQQQARAEEKEELARKQAELALRSIQFVVTEIDDKLAEQPGMSDTRLAIMEAVSRRWDEIDLQLSGGIRGEAVPTLMALRQKIGVTYLELDRLREAQAEFEKLYRMGEERIALKGRNDATRTNLAKIALVWAETRSRLEGDPAATLELLERSAELVRETLRDPQPQEGSPARNDILELLGAAVQNLGVEYLRQGRLPEAAAAFQESLESNGAVLEAIRSAPGFAEMDDDEKDTLTASRQISYDKSAVGLAYLQFRLGQTEPAIALYERAIAARREILVRRPSMLPLRLELAGYLGNYGHSLLWLDRTEGAEPLLRESLQLHEEVFRADPEKADYKRMLSTALYRLATLRDLQGHADESLSLFERARQLREELHTASSDERNATNLMLAEARVGNVERAVAHVDRLGGNPARNGELHLERARALSQLARHSVGERQNAFRESALAALERAVAEGYSDPFRVRAEHDLRPLHDIPRFRAVLNELESRPRGQ